MMSINISMIMSLMIILMLPMIFSSLKSKDLKENSKMSSFECGFNPIMSNRMTFSTQFFLIMILYLIFDLEIVLIAPIPLEENKNLQNINMMGILLIILFTGLLMEWKQGMLEWAK